MAWLGSEAYLAVVCMRSKPWGAIEEFLKILVQVPPISEVLFEGSQTTDFSALQPTRLLTLTGNCPHLACH